MNLETHGRSPRNRHKRRPPEALPVSPNTFRKQAGVYTPEHPPSAARTTFIHEMAKRPEETEALLEKLEDRAATAPPEEIELREEDIESEEDAA
ncbi:MAG: hypothetical protein HYV42_01895 [Candidatus Magasanikbacteria bacterium]|nr:hypothetical protein [Candidatus Magasanikbacteria bacterium]